MFTNNKRKMLGFAGPLAATLLPLGAAWAAVGGAHEPLEGTPLPRCEIRIERDGGSVVLEGLVFTDAPMSGSYEMHVSQSGGGNSSDITQGGEFSIGAGSSESLGVVSLAGSGGYTARLSVEWDSGSIDCEERVGGKRVGLE
jgi:hypothetical protein